MTFSVGLPRGLVYYYLYPFLEGFLRSLGARVVISAPTDARILASLTCCPTDEPCISVKLFYAHTKNLLEKGVDYFFIPALSSLEPGSYCCPKFIGAAFMVQSGLGISPERILAPEINEKEKPGNWQKNLYQLGKRLEVGRKKVQQAIQAGQKQQEAFHRFTREGLTVPEAYARLDGLPSAKERIFDPAACYDPQQVIGVMGHPYILYDFVGHNVVARLREHGQVITAEMVSLEDSRRELATVYEGKKMWTNEGHLLGAALHLLRRHLVKKMVFVEAFACGPASIIEPYLEEEAERQGIPFLLLTVDEHTGEAGLLTRLEAFVDTADRRTDRQQQQPYFQDNLPPPTVFTERDNGRKDRPGQGEGSGPMFIPGARPAQLKIGAPSVGWSDKAIAAVLESCGVDMVPTPAVTRKTVELGKELAPEFICYPMITVLGQIRELLEAGANMIIMVGGKGRCRLGWYAQIQDLLLRRKGYDFQLAIIDSPVPLRKNWRKFKEDVKLVTNNSSWWKILRGFYLGYLKMRALDEAEKLVRRKRAYESKPGAAGQLQKKFIRRVLATSNPKDIERAKQDFDEELHSLSEEQLNPLKVKIVGEFYAVIQNFVNNNIEEFLTSRPGLRVQIEQGMTASGWFDLHVLHKKHSIRQYQQVISAAAPYLPVSVGGHGQESIGEVFRAKQEGVDGIIHLFPFTCMPEIVAQSILIPLCQELDLPFLSLVVSEQTGTAGLETRLEAFLEVLLERAEKKINSFGGDRYGLLLGY